LHRTRIPHEQDDLVSDASRLLDLGGLAVDRVASGPFGGRALHFLNAGESAFACPGWWGAVRLSEGRVCALPRDIPYGTQVLRLIWPKR
jgi:hypothetical protein